MNFEIREAQPSDAECIHGLIKELCTYEKVDLSEVETTPEDLIKDGLDKNGVFKCLVAEVDVNLLDEYKSDQIAGGVTNKEIIGYALYYFGYSTWKGKLIYLEDIYVKQKYRGNGVGTSFFKRIGQIALESNCCRIVFMCLDWNEPSKEFYFKIGAEELPEWQMFNFRNEKIKDFLSQ